MLLKCIFSDLDLTESAFLKWQYKTACCILSDFFLCKDIENTVNIISLKKVFEVSFFDLGCSSIQAGLIHPSAFTESPQGDDYLPVLEGQTEKKKERKK